MVVAAATVFVKIEMENFHSVSQYAHTIQSKGLYKDDQKKRKLTDFLHTPFLGPYRDHRPMGKVNASLPARARKDMISRCSFFFYF